jgi:hypothetical protein
MQERPNTQYRIFRSLAVGDDQGGGIGAMTLPGTRIRGVIVDNPSGSWVQLDGVGLAFLPYIAPYTLAWSVSLLPSVSELSVRYVDGPTGQLSSATGAPIVVYLFEAQVPSSPGSTFVAGSVRSYTIWPIFNVGPGGSAPDVSLLPAIPGSSYRIRFLSAKQPLTAADSVNLALMDSTHSVFLGNVGLSPQNRFEAVLYPDPGVDLPIGAGLVAIGGTIWSTLQVDLNVIYEIV